MPNVNRRIYVFNAPDLQARGLVRKSPAYCNLTHALVEGLGDLGVGVSCAHENPLRWPTAPFRDDYYSYLVHRHPNLDTADVFRTLQRHACLPRTAFIDAMDERFGLDWFWARSAARYCKSNNHPRFGVTALPYCILDRYIPETCAEPQDVVFFACNLATHPDRPLIRAALERGPWTCEFGPLHDTDADRSERYRRIAPYHNHTYYRRLNECKVAVNAPGGAWDCYRYWEIAAGNAVLVSFPVEDRICDFPDPPIPGVHYVPYRSIDEINDAVASAFERYDELHAAQHDFFLNHHRSRHRAAAVLQRLESPTSPQLEPPLIGAEHTR